MARTKWKEPTTEEKLKNELEQLKRELEHVPYPPQRRILCVGDKVGCGNLAKSFIKEVYDNGRYYLMEYTGVNNNYGNPIYTEGMQRYVTWLNVTKIPDRTGKELIKYPDTMRSLNFLNTCIKTIFSKVYYFGVDMNPAYQRDYCWELKDKVALIDSIFAGADIGKFVFRHYEYNDREDHVSNEVIDGKQRISALCDFYEDRFQYNGLYYSELSNYEKHVFEDFDIQIAEVRGLNDKQILELFVRLNKSGKRMDEEHLQKVENMLL
jgi:hypothetical protein